MTTTVRIDAAKIVRDYHDKNDIAKENANSDVGPSGLMMAVGSEGLRRFTLQTLKDEGFEEIVDLHNKGAVHIHDLGMGIEAPYCCGNSLPNLLASGMDVGVSAAPAKHLNSAINQMVNFIGTQSNDYSGAQAFNGVDTYLAPYAYKMYLDLKKEGCAPATAFRLARRDVYQAIQNFIFHLNYTTRFGNQCVTEDTEVLTPAGFKKYDELRKGDDIYTWKDGVCEIQPVQKVNIYDHDGEMHEYSGRDINQTVTPDHRVLYRTGSNPFRIDRSEKIIDSKSPIYIPVGMDNLSEDYNISDEWLEMLVFILTDGSIDTYYDSVKVKWCKSKTRWGIGRFLELCDILNINHSHAVVENKEWGSTVQVYNILQPSAKIIADYLNYTKKELPDLFSKLSQRQAQLVIDTWAKLDGCPGSGKIRLQLDTEKLQDQMQHVCFLAGKGSRKLEILVKGNKTPTKYVYVYKRRTKAASVRRKFTYKGKVWCPTTANGVVVFRKDGKLFISGNCPFSNVTLDITIPHDMKDQLALIAGKPIDAHFDYTVDGVRVNNHTYGELWEWQRLVAEAFLDTFNKGDANGKGFTFPVLTLNVDEGFFDHPLTDKICEFTAKYGIPFFQNFINGVAGGNKMDPKDVRALCCRLNLDLAEISKKTGGLFGSSDNTGSIMNVTVSLPYIAEETKGQGAVAFYGRLRYIMERIRELHQWKRTEVTKALDSGYLALSKQVLPHKFKTFFTTVGFIGEWEAVEILTQDEMSLLTEGGLKIGKNVLNHMVTVTKEWAEKYEELYNLEETPGESASYKLAKKALKQFPDIKHRGTKKAPYFTNGCNIPAEFQDDVSKILKVRTELQPIPTGGTATHFYVAEKWTSEQVKEFIKTICQTPIPYFSISTVYSICPICGYHIGAHETCPNEHTPEEIAELKRKHPEMVV